MELSERELAAISNPEVVESIKRGIADAHAGRATTYEPGHFAKKLAELGEDVEDE